MPFPISLSGTVSSGDLTPDQALERLESALLATNARDLRRAGTELTFRGGLRLSGTNVLGPITHGQLRVKEASTGVQIAWVVTLGQLLLMVTGAVALMGLLPQERPFPGGPIPYLLPWLFLVGGNTAVTRWRWPRFLARALRTPAHPVSP